MTFLGDAKDLNRAIGDVDDAMGKASGKISAKTKAAAAGGVLALGTALFKAGDAAAEDEAAATALAKTLENVTGATKDQVAQVEKLIKKTSLATGVTDGDLRPAFDKLVRATGSTEKAQQLLGLAMDVSVGTGKDLGSVTDALGKAYNGNEKAIKALAPELTDLIKDGASADEIFGTLGKTFGGQTQAATETAAGKMAILRVRLQEAQEELGAKLLPIALKFSDWLLVTAIPAIEKFSHWVRDEMIPQIKDMWAWFDRNIVPVLKDVVGAIGEIIQTGTAIVTFLADMTVKFWRFGVDVKEVVSEIVDTFERVGAAIARPFISAFNTIADAWNATIGSLPSFTIGIPGLGSVTTPKPPKMPKFNLGEGGIVPGARGTPQFGILHGGETVLPTHKPGYSGQQQQQPIILQIDGRTLWSWMVDDSRNAGGIPLTLRSPS